jgi:plasmid maintenance system antidote protein VapI
LELAVLHKILEKDRAITRDFAKALGEAFGTSADLWYQMSLTWRWWSKDTPPEAVGWLNIDLRRALDEIKKPHVAKKRATVLLLASATANDVPWSHVFEDPRVCNQRIWYQRWQNDPAISEALEIATRAALRWRDEQTAAIEARASQLRRRAIAEGSLDAVQGLRDTAKENRDQHGIKASETLLALSDEEAADTITRLRGVALPIEVQGLESAIEQQLERVADMGEGEDAGTSAADADTD